jgi:hypothetical protein
MTNKKFRIKMQVLTLCVFLVFIFFPFAYKRPSEEAFTDGFKIRMKKMADVESIREWLRTIDKDLCTNEAVHVLGRDLNTTNWPDSVNWPPSVTKFHPGYVCLAIDQNDNPKLELTWGGPFAHWGLVVGHETLETRPSDPANQISVREISKGAYIWYDHH